MILRVALSKSGKRYVCLMYKDIIVSLDRDVICKVADLRPSEYRDLVVGDYPIA